MIRNVLIALAGAMSAVALQGCFFFPIPYTKTLTSGLNKEDELDRAFWMGGNCPSDSLQKALRTSLPREYCDRAVNEFVQVIRKQREHGVSPKAYLLSKGGTCTETAKRHWRCVVERVVTTTYCRGNTDAFYDLFTSDCLRPESRDDHYLLTVEIPEIAGDIRVDFHRL